MPKAPTQEECELAAYLARRDEFEQAFRRSRKGNLWRHFEGMTLTIFGRDDGRFGWCIVDAEGEKRFSKKAFEDQESAMGDLADAEGLCD